MTHDKFKRQIQSLLESYWKAYAGESGGVTMVATLLGIVEDVLGNILVHTDVTEEKLFEMLKLRLGQIAHHEKHGYCDNCTH